MNSFSSCWDKCDLINSFYDDYTMENYNKKKASVIKHYRLYGCRKCFSFIHSFIEVTGDLSLSQQLTLNV